MISNLKYILLTNGAILIVPGLNFALIAYHSANNSMRAGILCVLGVVCAIAIHAVGAILGAIALHDHYPHLFKIIKICGGVFICFVAFSIFISVVKNKGENSGKFDNASYFMQGFLIDLFNPMILIFYMSLFTQIVGKNVEMYEFIIYIFFIIFITFLWFSLVAKFFSMRIIREISNKHINKVKITSSLILAYYGINSILL